MTEILLPHRGADLHVRDFGGAPGPGRPTFLLVHGLGGSVSNFVALAPHLARLGRVLAVDLPGFGLSPPGAGSNVPGHVAAVERVLGAIGTNRFEGARAPVVLLGNSMGGAVAILTASRRPAEVSALVLVCPALPVLDPRLLDRRFALFFGAALLPGYDTFLRRQLGRAGPEALVTEMLRLCCVDPGRVPAEAVEAMKAVARRRMGMAWMGSAFSSSARSVFITLLRAGRFQRAMKGVRAPTLLVHGARDRLVPVAAASAAVGVCPRWQLEIFDDIGHVPQLEAPERLAYVMEAFLARPDCGPGISGR